MLSSSSSFKSSCELAEDRSSLCWKGPTEWARGVSERFSGTRLKYFAEWLMSPSCEEQADGDEDTLPTSGGNSTDVFASLYDFDREGAATHLHSPADLEAFENSKSTAQLLVLRGYASAAWITAIGAAFQVDVDFFYRHMRLYSRRPSEAAWEVPPLAFERVRSLRFRLTELGRSTKAAEDATSETCMSRVRKHAKSLFESYLKDVRHEKEVKPGTSLLRGIAIHDSKHLTLERDVSVWTTQTEKGWFALVWLDAGADIVDGPRGSTLATPLGGDAGNTEFEPIALPAHDGSTSTDPSEYHCIRPCTRRIGQTHDWAPDHALARADCFYALSKVFRFAAASEQHFLGRMKYLIRKEIDQGTTASHGTTSLSNLHASRDLLEEHVLLLDENVAAIKKSSAWPRARACDGQDQQKIDTIRGELAEAFLDLARTTRALVGQCDTGTTRITDVASHVEKQKAIAQAGRVELLTRLAFIFIPMGFTAGFFGQNFKEFGQGTLSVWIWFALTIPIVISSVIFMIPACRQRVLGVLRLAWTRKLRATDDGDIEYI